jgi:ubiquinone/menaquinone biosynthesis C-methylase UbiE
MKIPSQKNVWDNIAEEWDKFKVVPAEHAINFLKGKSGKVLDLGSGSGRNLVKIKKGKMYLVDFSEKMIELAKKKAGKEKIDAEFAVAEAKKLPFEDNFFDYAISTASLHCVEGKTNREKAVKELFRVLKKGGEAEISVWNKDTKWFRNSPKERYVKWRDKGARYYYLFSPDEIYGLFEKAGFKIISKEEPQRNITFIIKKPGR